MATINAIDTGKPIEVSKGGTGASTLTIHGVLLGNTTGAIGATAEGATGSGLMGTTGAVPGWTGSPSYSGTVTGGTGLTATTGNVTVSAGNVALPTTSATAGQITVNGANLIHAYGTGNIFAGAGSGNFTLTTATATYNVFIGYGIGDLLTTGASNAAVGFQALDGVSSGSNNSALGSSSLAVVSTGSHNCGVGTQAGWAITTGSYNCCLGYMAGTDIWNTAQSSNICLQHIGVNNVSNKMYLGTDGTGNGQVDTAYIAGNVFTTSAVAGATRSLTVANSDNTNAASAAVIKASTGGASAGDAQFQATTTTTTWTFGIDNSVTVPTADTFVIAQGTALGTNNVMSIATSGEINLPLQPSFRAYASALTDVSGDGTAYDVVFANEVYDQNADFDGTSTFTAPVTGRYLFNVGLAVAQLAAGHVTGSVTLTTTGGTYVLYSANPVVTAVGGALTIVGSIIIPMTATNTAKVTLTIGGGGKDCDVTAGDVNSWFAGQLIA